MKIISNILIILVSVFILSAYPGFLNPEPRAQYTEVDTWNPVDNTYLYTNGFYKSIYEYGSYGVKYIGVSLTDGFSDILRCSANIVGGSGDDIDRVVYIGGISSQGSPLSDYIYEYNCIRYINELLHGLKTYTKYGDRERLIMEAQTRFSRAYLHFMPVRGHGSAIVRGNADDPSEVFKERNPESTCWNFIESDLDFATENLSNTWPKKDLGRITRGAVYGFRSYTTLYAKRREKATDVAAKVVAGEDELYDLMPNYTDIFNQSDSHKEAVLGYRFHGQLVYSMLSDRQYSPKGDSPETDMDGKYLVVPTQGFVDFYRTTDGSSLGWNNLMHAASLHRNREPHFYVSILCNGATREGRITETFMGGKDGSKPFDIKAYPNATTTGYYIRKLLNESVKSMTVKGITCWNEIRYVEILLSQTRTLNGMGETAEVLIPLNKVRSKAKLSTVSPMGQESLRNIIREERKIELASGDQRYWDSRRWGMALEVLGGKRVYSMKITR